jgi:hypothetical protein
MTLPTSQKTVDVSTAADAITEDEPIVADARQRRGGAFSILLSAGAVLLLVPIALYVWFIHRYGVNAIYYDQWDNIGLLTHIDWLTKSYSHPTTFATLWWQHGEDRMFFPNLIVLSLGHLTNMNTLTELYVSAALLLSALVLIILAHRQDVTRTHLVLYLPVAFLVFTLGQFENTLFGFNLWLYVVIAVLAATIFLLDLPRLSWLILLAAIAMAVVGTYSALDGLAIWPAGLVVLLWKRRPRAFVLTWLIAAIATSVPYFYHYDFTGTGANGGGPGYVLAHPLSGIGFFFFAIGDLTGGPVPHANGDSDPVIVGIGVAVFLLAVVCLALYGRRRNLSRSPIGPALICFGILLATLVTIGRANLGFSGASQSRYVTEDLFILVGCYLCLLERWPGHQQESVLTSFSAAFSAAVSAFRNADPIFPTIRGAWRQGLLVALRGAAILLIAVEVWGGIEDGIPNGAADRNVFRYADLVAAHAACAPDSLLRSALFPNQAYPYSNVRALAVAAKKDHLSFFASSDASQFEHMKLPPASEVRPQTSVVKPSSGAIVGGGVYLVAQATAKCLIKAVNFQITGSGGQHHEVLPAERFPYGWLGGWHTTNVPNGLYTVQSTARDIEGHVRTSRPVLVTVQN